MDEPNITFDPSTNSEDLHCYLNDNYFKLLSEADGNSGRFQTAEQSSCSRDYTTARSSCPELGRNQSVATGIDPLTDPNYRSNGLSDINSNTDSMVDGSGVSSQLKKEDIPKKDYPPEYKEGQYDVVFIYSEHDVDQALRLRDLFQKFFILDDGEPVSVCVLDGNFNLRWIQSRFSHLDEALKRSTYMFLFITEHFVKDQWADLQKDECLMESLENLKKRWCVVPIFLQPKREVKFRLPSGLRALKGVDISRLLPGTDLCNVDVEELTIKDLDKHIVNNMKIMLNERLSMKKAREVEQQKELDEWKLDEIMRREQQREVDEKYRRQRELKRRMFREPSPMAPPSPGLGTVPRASSGPNIQHRGAQEVIYNFRDVGNVIFRGGDPSSHQVIQNPNRPMEEPEDDMVSFYTEYDVEVSGPGSLSECPDLPEAAAGAHVLTNKSSGTEQSSSIFAGQHHVPPPQGYQHNEAAVSGSAATCIPNPPSLDDRHMTEISKALSQLPAARGGNPPSQTQPRQKSIGSSDVIRGQSVAATSQDNELSEAIISAVYMDRQNSSRDNSANLSMFAPVPGGRSNVRPVVKVSPFVRPADPHQQPSVPAPARIYPFPVAPQPSDETTLKQLSMITTSAVSDVCDETVPKQPFGGSSAISEETLLKLVAIADDVAMTSNTSLSGEDETVPKVPFIAPPEHTQLKNVFQSENGHVTSTSLPVMPNPVAHVTDTVSSLDHSKCSPMTSSILPKPVVDDDVSRPVDYTEGNRPYSTMAPLLSEQPTLLLTIAQSVTSSMAPPMMSGPNKPQADYVVANQNLSEPVMTSRTLSNSGNSVMGHVMSGPDASGEGRSTSMTSPLVCVPNKPVTADQLHPCFTQSLNVAGTDPNTTRPYQSVAHRHGNMSQAVEIECTPNTTGASNKECHETVKGPQADLSAEVCIDNGRNATLGNPLSTQSLLTQGMGETSKEIANAKIASGTNREYEMSVFNISNERNKNEIARPVRKKDPHHRKRDAQPVKTEADKSDGSCVNSSPKAILPSAHDETSVSGQSNHEEAATATTSASESPKSDSKKSSLSTFLKAFWK